MGGGEGEEFMHGDANPQPCGTCGGTGVVVNDGPYSPCGDCTAVLAVWCGGPSHALTVAIHSITRVDPDTGQRWFFDREAPEHLTLGNGQVVKLAGAWVRLRTSGDFARLNQLVDGVRGWGAQE